MEGSLLKETARKTKFKNLFVVILSSDKSEFIVENDNLIKSDRESRYEVALVNLGTY